MIQLTKEIVEKLQVSQSGAEMASILRDSGIEVTDQDAEMFYKKYVKKELSDDELEQSAGGGEQLAGCVCFDCQQDACPNDCWWFCPEHIR